MPTQVDLRVEILDTPTEINVGTDNASLNPGLIQIP